MCPNASDRSAESPLSLPVENFSRDLVFYLNGQRIELSDVDPGVLLLDWLRSPDVGLTGAKKGCGQGGCGLCTVMLSRWDEAQGKSVSCSINSCLHPLAALDGMSITTIEGVGSTQTEVSPVQWEIAAQNGSQCGYCTPGWVMTMHSELVHRDGAPMTQEEIECQFDGNLCRCTGYRPILYAMRHFAEDWGPKDTKGCMRCVIDPAEAPQRAPDVTFDFPEALERPLRQVAYERDGYRWVRSLSLETLMQLWSREPEPSKVKLVVGNTSIGIYDRFVDRRRSFIDISQVPELVEWTVEGNHLRLGAAVTYSDLLELLPRLIEELPEDQRGGLEALHYLAHRTAGHIVRNAASLAGNTMLVAQHVAQGTPFPSDLFTALSSLDAIVHVASPSSSASEGYEILTLPLLEFGHTWYRVDALRQGILIAYEVPFGETGEFARTYKTAIRGVNAHSITNAGFRVVLDAGRVRFARLIYGGIGPVAFRAVATEEWLEGRPWDEETLSGALRHLSEDVARVIADSAERMASVPYEGFSDTYRLHLAQSFFYQFFIYVAERVAPEEIPASLRSAGQRYVRPVSRGTQHYQSYEDEYPVNEPYVKLSAFQQAAGEAVYTHDLPLPRLGLEGALVTSARANAMASYRVPGVEGKADVDGVIAHLRETFPGFHSYISCRDILEVGGTVLQGSGSDEPLLTPIDETVSNYESGLMLWQGQQIGVVLADEERLAQDIAHYVQNVCLSYEDLDNTILTIEQAIEEDSVFKDEPPWPVHIWKIIRTGSQLDWVDTPPGETVRIDGVECRVVRNEHQNGGQIHFYMETQAALAERGENQNILVYASSQSPDSVTGGIHDTLGLAQNRIDVRVKHLGGGYGGKTTRSPFTASWAALAAWQTDRPVRLALAREVDTGVVGRRHPLLARHRLAIATGNGDEHLRGKLLGVDADYWFDGGGTYDCSFTVMDCLQLRSDSAYMVPNYRSSGEVCKTNKTSNTAYRAFGMVQSMVAYEDSIEHAALSVDMLAEDVREKNLYEIGDSTPFGQYLEYCYMRDVWDYARQKSQFDRRLEEVRAFNRANRWRKRGISLVPVKYGSGYNLASLEQGGALLEVFKDGTVLVRQGGVEMGQGVWTKVVQIAAYELNLPISIVQIADVDVQVVPNPESTGASTGTALNGGAVKKAANLLRARLENFCLGLLREHGSEWCRQNQVNFWDYEDGWQHPTSSGSSIWTSIVSQAFDARVNLSSQVRYRQQGGTTEDEWGKAGGLEFHPGAYEEVDHFVGFTYSVACSEVEVDILTGETTIRRSDIFYDMGKSLNPAIDVGQVEGAFVQGVGYVLTEELVWQPDGPDRGGFYTLNTWEYKPPAISTIPLELNVNLYPRDDSSVPENPYDLLGAKEVGEPPLVLAVTVFLAVKRAVLASREQRGLKGWFRLDAPATVQRVREAADIDLDALNLNGTDGA